MRRLSLLHVVTSALIILSMVAFTATIGHAQLPSKPTVQEPKSMEGQLPSGSIMKQAILELANGSTESVDYALTPKGTAVMDGDILITVDEDGRARIAKEFDRLWGERNAFGKAYKINGSSFRWSNNTVPFEISVGTAAQRTTILNAMQHIEDLTPVRFIPRAGETDFVDFENTNGVCRSFVGRQGGRQEIELDPTGCPFGTVVHEIGHALGLWHEQQRSDRGNSVIVNWNNIQVGASGNFQTRSGTWRGPFDFQSIMNYGSFDFSRNGLPTLTRLNGSTWARQRTALTATDATGISDMYPRIRATITMSCYGFANQCDFWGGSQFGVRPVTSWNWTIEDGTNVIRTTGHSVSHQFQTPNGVFGPNNVFLEIIDSQGDRASEWVQVDFAGCGDQIFC